MNYCSKLPGLGRKTKNIRLLRAFLHLAFLLQQSNKVKHPPAKPVALKVLTTRNVGATVRGFTNQSPFVLLAAL